MLRKHLCTRIGSVPIQKLRASDLQAVYAAMAQDGLADLTRLHLHWIVHVMLKHATQWGIVPRNVADMMDAPPSARDSPWGQDTSVRLSFGFCNGPGEVKPPE